MNGIKDLFNCSGWQAINRIGAFSNMHNIFQQNYIELNDLLTKIHVDIQLSKETIYITWMHLEQRLFNYLSSASSLIEHARKMMNFYKGKNVFLKYDEKIQSSFRSDSLSQFIKGLRNYQIHCKITPMTFSHTGRSVNVIFLSEELLNTGYEWNVSSRKFIKHSGTEINLIDIITEYTNKVNSFYMWLYKELLEYHAEDIKQKNVVAKNLGINITELENDLKYITS